MVRIGLYLPVYGGRLSQSGSAKTLESVVSFDGEGGASTHLRLRERGGC